MEFDWIVITFQALCSLLRRDASINFKAKGNSLVSVLACNLLMAAYEEDENWPEIFVKVRISSFFFKDSTFFCLYLLLFFMLELFVNPKCIFRCTLRTHWGKESGWTVLTARISLTTSKLLLGRRCPLRVCCCRLTLAALAEISVQVRLYWENTQACLLLILLLQENSADRLIQCLGFNVMFLGSSPHPSTPDEDDSQTELLIAEEKLSPEDEGQVMPRYQNNPYRCDATACSPTDTTWNSHTYLRFQSN